METTESTVEGFEQETIDERIEALLEAWGVVMDEDDDEYDAQEAGYQGQRAFDLAVSYPSEIATDLFMEIVEMRGWR